MPWGKMPLRRYMIPIREEDDQGQEMARQLREGLEHGAQERALLRGNTSWLRVTGIGGGLLNASLTAFG